MSKCCAQARQEELTSPLLTANVDHENLSGGSDDLKTGDVSPSF